MKKWGQNGLNKYVGPRYEKISQQFPEKSRRWVRLKRDGSLTPEEAKNYLESLHKKIKVEFPAEDLDQMSNVIPTQKDLKAQKTRKAPEVLSMLDELTGTSTDTSTYSRDVSDEDLNWIKDAFTLTQD